MWIVQCAWYSAHIGTHRVYSNKFRKFSCFIRSGSVCSMHHVHFLFFSNALTLSFSVLFSMFSPTTQVYFDFVMIAILTVSCIPFWRFYLYEISHVTKYHGTTTYRAEQSRVEHNIIMRASVFFQLCSRDPQTFEMLEFHRIKSRIERKNKTSA